MSRLCRAAALLLGIGVGLGIGGGILEAAQGPALAVGKDGLLMVSALPEVLSRPEVKPHLATGLTTSFVLRVTGVDGSGRKVRGAGRLDVRYELWDEVFLIRRMGADGRGLRETVATYDRLLGWWRNLELPVLPAGQLSAGEDWDFKVEVDVIPFSQSEQKDTQRWFSDSLGGGGQAGAGAPSTPGSRASAPSGDARSNGVLDLLIATSIKRRSIVSYAWKASYRPAGRR